MGDVAARMGALTAHLHPAKKLAGCHEIAWHALNLILDSASGERRLDLLGQPFGIRMADRVATSERVAEAQDAEGFLGALLGGFPSMGRHGLVSF